MKVNWVFVGVIAFVSFMLGFVKPLLNANVHLAVSLFTYWLIWYFLRTKSTSVDAESHAKWTRWILLLALIVTAVNFLKQFDPPNVILTVTFDTLIVAGIVYCSSSKVRLWTRGFFSKSPKSS